MSTYEEMFPRRINTYKVIKRNSRLYIQCVETQEFVYTPPDFLRSHIHSRKPLEDACERLQTENYISLS